MDLRGPGGGLGNEGGCRAVRAGRAEGGSGWGAGCGGEEGGGVRAGGRSCLWPLGFGGGGARKGWGAPVRGNGGSGVGGETRRPPGRGKAAGGASAGCGGGGAAGGGLSAPGGGCPSAAVCGAAALGVLQSGAEGRRGESPPSGPASGRGWGRWSRPAAALPRGLLTDSPSSPSPAG